MNRNGEFYISTGDYENPTYIYIYDKINNDNIAYVIDEKLKIIYYDDIWPESLMDVSFIKELKDKDKYMKYFIKIIFDNTYKFVKG